MPRKYVKKGNQTCKEKAGEQNFTPEIIAKQKDPNPDGTMAALIPMMEIGFRHRGFNWTCEELRDEIAKYFNYIMVTGLKPCKAGIRVWLGISRSQYFDWETKKEIYGGISDLINFANDIMENQYIGRAEKYPTANIFLLKTSHGHVEKSAVDITSNGKDIKSADEINDVITKLGLDK